MWFHKCFWNLLKISDILQIFLNIRKFLENWTILEFCKILKNCSSIFQNFYASVLWVSEFFNMVGSLLKSFWMFSKHLKSFKVMRNLLRFFEIPWNLESSKMFGIPLNFVNLFKFYLPEVSNGEVKKTFFLK